MRHETGDVGQLIPDLRQERRAPLAEPQRGHVTEILRGGRHLMTLINEVLDLSSRELAMLRALLARPDAWRQRTFVEDLRATA